jgi:hypothetical protein
MTVGLSTMVFQIFLFLTGDAQRTVRFRRRASLDRGSWRPWALHPDQVRRTADLAVSTQYQPERSAPAPVLRGPCPVRFVDLVRSEGTNSTNRTVDVTYQGENLRAAATPAPRLY